MASKSKKLTQFRVEGEGDAFQMHIEDDAGETIEFEVTRDQLDVIVDSLDDILNEDDA
jgi:hypothetical protein